MAKSKLRKSAADYVAIAIAPALIMLLVGSLAHYLMDVFGGGNAQGRLHWVLFWFVIAIVLVARIGIEEGTERALIFGTALAGATTLVILLRSSSPLISIILMGVIWWSAHHLTWDSTLIDDDQDASGHGLLHATGIAKNSEDDEKSAVELNSISEQTTDTKPLSSLHQTLKEKRNSRRTQTVDSNSPKEPKWKRKLKPNKKNDSQLHSPGTWAVYFGLAALPLFGLGEIFGRSVSTSENRGLLPYLIIYVFAALGLLLTTSFLGLRRYLRQRKLTMPKTIVAGWLGWGGSLLGIVMLGAMLLPRPDAKYSVTSMLDRISDSDQNASQYAVVKSESGTGEGARIGSKRNELERLKNDQSPQGRENENPQQDPKAKPKANQPANRDEEKNAAAKRQQTGNAQNKKSKQPAQQKSNSKENRPKNSDSHRQSKRQPQATNKSNANILSQMISPVGTLLKWIIYAILIGAACFLLFKYQEALLDGLNLLLAELGNFWNRLFSRKPKFHVGNSKTDSEKTSVPRKTFSDLQNPFRDGSSSLSTDDILNVTMEAIQLWGTEQGFRWSADQTVLEYTRGLGDHLFMQDPNRELARAIHQAASIYSHRTYGNETLNSEVLSQLEQVWSRLESHSTE